MAMNATAKLENGTATTATITLTSLATATTGNAREGNFIDFGATRDASWLVTLKTKPAAAPTAQKTLDVYISLASGTATALGGWPGGATGVNTAFVGPSGNIPNAIAQMVWIGTFVVCASAVSQIQNVGVFSPTLRYGTPIVVNNMDQALSSTAGDHVLTLTPIDEGANTA